MLCEAGLQPTMSEIWGTPSPVHYKAEDRSTISDSHLLCLDCGSKLEHQYQNLG